MIDPWEPPRKREQQYQNAIQRALAGLREAVRGASGLEEIQAAVEAFAASKAFREACRAIAARMVTHTLSWSGRTWREAAKAASKGQRIHNALTREIQGNLSREVEWQILRNARLISSIPEDLREQMAKEIARLTVDGMRPAAVAQRLQDRFPQMAASRAALIARTEVSKTQTAIVRARAEELGVGWYVWHSTGDARTRKSHRLMNHVLCAWNDPPSPERLAGERDVGAYAPGEIWNCRCYAEPLTSLDRVRWPHKVYYGGRIQTMTRAQFMKIGGMAA